MVSAEAVMRSTSWRLRASSLRCESSDTNSPSACSGWRRSWLAAARKRDFATLARSASSRRARSSAVASSIWRDIEACAALRRPAISFTPSASTRRRAAADHRHAAIELAAADAQHGVGDVADRDR